MKTNQEEKSIRDKYFDNEIFRIGDMVTDTTTSESVQIIDRGSNYVTVATSHGVTKKWLNEVIEDVKPSKPVDTEFQLTESGQIKLFGYESKNFDRDTSEFIIEQFTEFTDLYSKHQIIKCLDLALQESDTDKSYALVNKVLEFYTKNNLDAPLIVEITKSSIERQRIVDILVSIADIKPAKTQYDTITDAIKKLKEKYKLKSQWEIILPFFKIAQDSGISGIMGKLPFTFPVSESEITENVIVSTIEDNLDLAVDDLDFDDIDEAFQDEDDSDELLLEVLSIETRNKLSRKLKQKEPVLVIKRERALAKAANSGVLMARARKLAETILKRRIFHKPSEDMTRQEKERFEGGAMRRRALVARLAQRLMPKVRELQTQRLHHSNTPVTHNHDIATAAIARSTKDVGAA